MTEEIMDKVFDFFTEKEMDKVSVYDIWKEFIEPTGMNEILFFLGNDDRFTRVIGVISPTRGETVAKYSCLSEVPTYWKDDNETFRIDETNIQVWYELNE